MAIEQKILSHIRELVQQAEPIVTTNKYGYSAQSAECTAWIGAADHIASLACTSPENAYRKAIARSIAKSQNSHVHVTTKEISALLTRLGNDIEQGLLTSVANETRVETFDDFLDHAEAYLGEGKKDPAGAIVGVVFEDTIRRLCRANVICEDDKSCEPMINALTSCGVLTKIEGKEAKTAANLRTDATHALWDNFNADQVDATIKFTRRLIREKLSG